MNLWFFTDIVLLVSTIPCGILMLRARRLSDCLVAVQFCGVVGVLVLLVLAQGMKRPSFMDLAIVLAVLQFPAGVVMAHFVERWLR